MAKPKFMNAPFDVQEGFYEKKEKLKSEKEYLILAVFNDGTGDKTFSFATGQAAAREYLIDNIADIKIHESYVIVEDLAFGEGMLSAYQFLKVIESEYNDSFDVEQYLLHKDTGNGEEEQRLMDNGDVEETNQPQQAHDLFISGNQLKELL